MDEQTRLLHDLIRENAFQVKLLWLNLAVVFAVIVAKILIYFKVVSYLREANKQLTETWGLLRIIKEWAYSGRVQHVEAAKMMEKVTADNLAQPSPIDLAKAVEEVPEKTAAKVVEKIKASDSGEYDFQKRNP